MEERGRAAGRRKRVPSPELVRLEGEVSSVEDGELEEESCAASRESGSAAGGPMALSSLVSLMYMLCLCPSVLLGSEVRSHGGQGVRKHLG